MSVPFKFRVYFADKSSLCLQISGDVQTATTDEIVSFVVAEMELGDEARNMFSLWIMSPSLEIQLKPHHVVCQILNKWSFYVSKYGDRYPYGDELDDNDADVNLIGEDPVVVFRRNVFYPVEKERMVCVFITFGQLF